jgi:transcriptional regulator with XRE-family HTH domain
MTFAETLRQARYDLHLTQGQLALALRRSTQTVSNWETGRSAPWANVERLVVERLRLMQGLVGRETQIEANRAKVETPLDLKERPGHGNPFPEHYKQHELWERAHKPRRVVLGEG